MGCKLLTEAVRPFAALNVVWKMERNSTHSFPHLCEHVCHCSKACREHVASVLHNVAKLKPFFNWRNMLQLPLVSRREQISGIVEIFRSREPEQPQ